MNFDMDIMIFKFGNVVNSRVERKSFFRRFSMIGGKKNVGPGAGDS